MAAQSASARPPQGIAAKPRRGGASKTAGVMAMLSIFLLLLAFFLMLNSLARFETTKTRAVLGSLNATFNIGNPAGPEHEFGSFVGKLSAAERIHAEAGDLLRTLFGFDQYKVIRVGNVIAVDISTRGFFVEKTTPTPRLLVFATRFVETVESLPPGTKLLTEVTVRRGPGVLDEVAPADLDLATRRSGAVVRTFERAGFPGDTLTAGIAAGDPRSLRIEFRITDALRPLAGGAQ